MPPHSPRKPTASPNWDDVYRVAEGQSGYFTRGDAADCGFSAPLLHHHVAAGAIQRARRGVYRLTRFPTTEHEDLVVYWLWSGKAGVFSHETALSLHELSDALPSRAHLTLPASWSRRRVAIPEGVVVHYAEVSKSERAWFHSIPITTVERTIRDVIQDAAEPELVRQAISQSKRRGLLAPDVARRLAAAARERSRAKKIR